MNRLVLTTLAATAAITLTLSAQQSNPAPPAFYSTTSYHVADENRAAYEAWMKDKYRRFAEALIKEEPSLTAISVTRVIYGGVIEPEANFFLTMIRQGYPKPMTELQNKVAKQLFGKTYSEFVAEGRPLSKRLGQTLSRRMVGTTSALEEGDLLRFDFKKVTQGRMGDYVQLERDYERLRLAQVKAGSMTGWGMNTFTLPGGSGNEYDAYTVHTGKSLEQVMTWGQKTAPIAATLDPPFNVTGLAMRGAELQKIVRSEVRVAVLVVRRK
ncbi:MAG TPA: hypothetical protein VGK29_07900 [Paludibaculum sp.]